MIVGWNLIPGVANVYILNKTSLLWVYIGTAGLLFFSLLVQMLQSSNPLRPTVNLLPLYAFHELLTLAPSSFHWVLISMPEHYFLFLGFLVVLILSTVTELEADFPLDPVFCVNEPCIYSIGWGGVVQSCMEKC